MAPDYTAVSVSLIGRDALRRMTATMTGHTGQRISMSDALRIAEKIVVAHSADIPSVAADLGISSGEDPK